MWSASGLHLCGLCQQPGAEAGLENVVPGEQVCPAVAVELGHHQHCSCCQGLGCTPSALSPGVPAITTAKGFIWGMRRLCYALQKALRIESCGKIYPATVFCSAGATLCTHRLTAWLLEGGSWLCRSGAQDVDASSLDAQDLLQEAECATGLLCRALAELARGRIWNMLSQRGCKAPTGSV